MTADFDSIIVGAGVVGLAVARALTLSGQSVLVLEKARGAGLETSSRNSEVIHAGIYYPTDSLRARLCVEGRGLLYDYCASHGVEAKRIGKMIAATTAEEEPKLNTIMSLAKANGVDDLYWLSASEAQEVEPEVLCTRALMSPSTGIVDAAGFMLSLQGEAQSHGADFAFNTVFQSCKRDGACFAVMARDGDGDGTEITSRNLINCAGHGAHEVASAVEGYAASHLPPRHYAKGSYCSVSGKSPFRHLVYPVPVPGALGIHATIDMGGALRLGPDIQWVEVPDYALPPGLPERFAAAVEKYWPGVRDRELSPSYCGIRPKIHGPERNAADFLIQDEEQHGVKGLVNLFGIESPGLTCALALAKRIQALQRLQ